jgi:hypothetical protein
MHLLDDVVVLQVAQGGDLTQSGAGHALVINLKTDSLQIRATIKDISNRRYKFNHYYFIP